MSLVRGFFGDLFRALAGVPASFRSLLARSHLITYQSQVHEMGRLPGNLLTLK